MLPSTSINCATSRVRITAQFRRAFHAAVRRLVDQLEPEHVLTEFPFLQNYLDEADEWNGPPDDSGPLVALELKAGLDECAIGVLFTVGLIEEDPRFGAVFEWAQPGVAGQQRATLGLLTAWWRETDDCVRVRESIRQLTALGLIEVVNPEGPRIFWAFRVSPLLWDALRGEAPNASEWFDYQTAEALPRMEDLVLPETICRKVESIPRLLREGEARGVIVRGALHNGRKTLLRAIAKAGGYGVLELRVPVKPDDMKCACLSTLAMMLDAMPLFTYELGPGETVALPDLKGYDGPQGIALSRQGTVNGAAADAALTLELPFPDPEARQKLWAAALRLTPDTTPVWTKRFLLTSGGIMRSAGLARAEAALEGRSDVNEEDVRHSHRALQQPLENQAMRLSPCGGWDQMVASSDTMAELHTLERRCRFREKLPVAAGPALGASVNRGVRALMSGPSGTGKTLAARVLASELQLDLYRLDLSAVVNKYIGETEKNLNQILSRAEELNVILLIDEGDALLTNRTAVQSSNDRYANLETNFLLQRIESFEGILLITTNALQRIDTAFQRRMDVLVEFRLPEPEERWNLWRLHLPPGNEVSAQWLEDVALRCNLSGGQIRNAALHASLVALDASRPVTTIDAEQAVQREYRKMGAVCPLRRGTGGR
jgi:hypothetical protein